MGRVRFRGRDWVRTTFWDRNVDTGSTKYVDPGPCLTWQITMTIKVDVDFWCSLCIPQLPS